MKRSLALFALALAISPIMRAQTLVISPNASNPNSDGQVFNGTLGELFTVNPGYTISVTGMGFWDFGTPGVDGIDTVSVAIFNNLGFVVTGTQINTTHSGTSGAAFSGSGYQGLTYSPNGANPGSGQFFVYTLTTPVNLTAGDYAIAGWGYKNVANYEINAGGNPLANFDLLSGALTLNGSSYIASDAVMPPAINETPGASIMAATFVATVTAIPEPSTYAAILGGLTLGLGALLRIRRRKAAV